MKSRKITRRIVEEALSNPDRVVAGRSNRKIVLKRHNDKWIKVIFEEGKDELWLLSTGQGGLCNEDRV